MKVLVLLSDAYGGHGGIAKFNRDLLEALCSIRELTDVVGVPRLMDRTPEEMPKKLHYMTSALGSKMQFVLAVFRECRAPPRPAIVVCAHINLLPIAWLAARLASSRLVLIVHGIDAWTPPRRMLSRLLARHVDLVVSVSELTLARFRSWAGTDLNSSFVLPNCVDLAKFAPRPRRLDLVARLGLSGKKIIATAGRLAGRDRQKGFDEVLEALPSLLVEFPDLTYLVIGDGEDRGRLEQKAASLGIANRVAFAGHVPESEKADYFSLADAYVMPSRGEGFGIVLLESMACGIPTIASRVDGGREALQDGKLGMLVDPDSQEEIVAAIRRALLNKQRTRPNGIEHFSREAFFERVQQFIRRLTSEQLTRNS